MTRRAPVRGGPARPRDARSPCGSTPALRGLPAGRCPPPGPTAQPSEWSSPTPSRRADRRSTQRRRCLLPRPVDTFGCVKTFGPRPPGPRLATMSSQPAQRHRGLVGRALADHGVRIVDTPTVRVHHPADLVGAVLSLIAIVLVLVLAVFAHRTTTGITQDVQGVAVVVRRVLFVPVAVLEGLVTFIAPIAVLAELVMRRLVRQAFEAVAGGLLAVLTALLAAWLITELGVPDLRSAFSIWSREANLALVTIPALMSGTAGLLTAAGQRSRRRTVAWSWNLLWVALGVALITGAVTLPGALLTVLIGRTTGLGLRYAFGVRSERAYGPALVAGIRRAGFTPVRLIRVRDVASTHPSGDDALATDLAAVAITRYGDNRVYAMTTENGDRLDVVVLDGDRQVVGILTRFWRSMRLRGIEGRAVVSLRQAAERAALLCYAAWSAGVCTPRLLGLAESEDSMILTQQHARGAVPLRDLPPDEVTDEVLDAIWKQLSIAHGAVLAHRALTADVVLVNPDADACPPDSPATGAQDPDAPVVLLTGWESGDVASSELARRMDISHLLAVLALKVGADRADLEGQHREEVADVHPARELRRRYVPGLPAGQQNHRGTRVVHALRGGVRWAGVGVRVHQHDVGGQRAVCQAGAVRDRQLFPDGVEHLVGHLVGRQVAQRDRAAGVLLDQDHRVLGLG